MWSIIRMSHRWKNIQLDFAFVGRKADFSTKEMPPNATKTGARMIFSTFLENFAEWG